jgi:hypothetical protein
MLNQRKISATKFSRSLLSLDQDSLARWGSHASLERSRGRLDETRKIYRTVLGSSQIPVGAAPLWWSWAEIEWLAGRPETSRELILQAAGVEGSTGVSILRARRALEGHIQPGSPISAEREAWIKLRALLEFLASSPSTALSVLDVHIKNLDPGSIVHERLTAVSLSLLYKYGTTLRNPIPPAILRQRAEKALEIYPSNSFILGLFLESQKGQGVWGKIREQLGEIVIDGELKEKDVMRRVIDVWIESGWEHGRWQSEKERVRAGLSNAMQHERYIYLNSGGLVC